jgi:hypothetical protein
LLAMIPDGSVSEVSRVASIHLVIDLGAVSVP